MIRTQLYLDEDIWTALRVLADNQHTSVSHLVREAVRDRYVGKLDERKKVMQAFVGVHETSSEDLGSEELVRELRRGNRIEELTNK